MICNLNIGIDVGSTTIKIVLINTKFEIIYSDYKRHNSDIKNTFIQMFNDIKEIIYGKKIKIKVSGSGGLLISDYFNINFIQEVIASTKAIKKFIPSTDVAIELGGEDAKITYFKGMLDQRMNGACAGGTGAFIDQMSVLLDTNAKGLNELSKEYSTIYPIASRCGVFAKTDVQPLINEGVSKNDIAASIFQAVVNQTIGGLSAGKEITGKVAFLGGPLTYLSELRNSFINTLNLKPENVIFPKHSRLYVAIGTAISAFSEEAINAKIIYDKLDSFISSKSNNIHKLKPLFNNKDEYFKFKERHNKSKIKRKEIKNAKGNLFLGIDAGSTTSKVALIDEDKNLIYSFYSNNNGQPLETIKESLIEIYNLLPKSAKIVSSTVTGYGEKLIKNAFLIDRGEIETIAHYKAGVMFEKNVDFILDIGGQDMKSLKIRDGIIESIMLNEACSSGCGSFVETFSKSLELDVNEFASKALLSENPVDLGTRCTVFMNSRVKQAQKEGASVGDISAGISYSIIKNALFKVIRLKDTSELGNNIVVQGGTFYNDAVLRSLEIILGKNVIRPDVAGLMGALGAAILSKEKYKENTTTNILNLSQLNSFSIEKTNSRCNLCGNQCLLTINKFNDNRKFITGNRCQRGAGIKEKNSNVINMYRYKYDRLFHYKPLNNEEAINGEIGIPRALNIYEMYPFWFSFFTKLKYKVVLSDRSNQKLFQKGISSIPSESVCYPAKLVHGHIENLIKKGIKNIFYPSIPFSIKEDMTSDNHYNCPVVTSYPETISANIESINRNNINYMKDFYPVYNKKQMFKKIVDVFSNKGHSKSELKNALDNAYEELEKYKNDIRKKGEEVIKYVKENNKKAIVLAGRPYHIDPEVNHGIADAITNYNIPVLTEDSIAHLDKVDRPLNIIDQWTYHTRLYNAANYVSKTNYLELIQLNSFGCGLDSVTTDQIKDILERNNKIYTNIKIDEISNLGAAKIRIRSLIAVMNKRKLKINSSTLVNKKEFTKKMKDDYTILAPQMAPIHFNFLEKAFQSENYNLKILKDVNEEIIEEGLKYVNNDSCYPSIIVVGQLMKAINSGNYDTNKLAVIISQTGGGCRATNYIAFIRKALKDANMDHIPVISLNAGGLEKNSGFKLNPRLIKKLTMALLYGDLLSKVVLKTRPYEKVNGSVNELYSKWKNIALDSLEKGKLKNFKTIIGEIINDFDSIELREVKKAKVGIVGEILVKFHPGANNNIIDFLEKEGVEVIMPGLTEFILYSSYNSVVKEKLLYESKISSFIAKSVIKYFEFFRKDIKKALENSKRFSPPTSIDNLAKKASKILSLGHQTGEGWLLTSEMVNLIEEDIKNIACIQPFACLPNHITGKAMIKKIRKKFPGSNITAIDYDPGASHTNQINRLKLMISTAKSNLSLKDK